MKVFLSWSGETSHKMALILKNWLRTVIPSIEDCWVSSQDIYPGARWNDELRRALVNSQHGILCLTPDNINAPWINFEAGAMSESLTALRVCPLLLGIKAVDLKGLPLASFQAVEFSESGVRKLVAGLNQCSEMILSTNELNDNFVLNWPTLRTAFAPLVADLPSASQIKYLSGSQQIYGHALQKLHLAQRQVRVLQFFGGPRPPEGYAEQAAKILRSKREMGIEVFFDAYLVLSTDRIPDNLEESNRQRLEIYKREGVGDLVTLHTVKMEYPKGFGFDMFMVDRKYVHLCFVSVNRADQLQRAIAFETGSEILNDLTDWFETAIIPAADRWINLGKDLKRGQEQ